MSSHHRPWLEQRRYPDLDPRAERALREAGLRFTEDQVAEAHLREAATIAPEHEAVLVAHYRYFLYKHRYEEASAHAAAFLARAAARLGLPEDPRSVVPAPAFLDPTDAGARAWMFACQAYAYVRMRAGHRQDGQALLRHLKAIDEQNQTRTRELLAVLERPEDPDED